jgi:hypothetical protein
MADAKPRKGDFADKREFLRASAEWAEANRRGWPWGGPKDEDDDYYYVVRAHGQLSGVDK